MLGIFHWKFWLVTIIVIIFISWLIWGGKTHEFIGIRELQHQEILHEQRENYTTIDEERSNYVDPGVRSNYVDPGVRSNYVDPGVRSNYVDPGVRSNYVDHDPEPVIATISKKSVGEQLLFQILNELFPDQEIISGIRPKFLTNPETNSRLELDCYLPNIGLAFEYNGKQHYEFPNSFHRTQIEFKNQVYRDNLKRELCDKNGIVLICVPYHVDMCSFKNGTQVCSKSVKRETRYIRIREYLNRTIENLISGYDSS